MKSDKIQSAIGKIDVDLIEAADRQKAFAKLDTRAAPMQPRGLSEAQKGGNNMKNRKPLRIALIAAVVVLLLAGTVAAAGYYAGWLTPALPNAEEESEFLNKTVTLDASVVVENERWTVNNVLMEGDVVFIQFTRECLDGSEVPEQWPDGCMGWSMDLLDASGKSLAQTYDGGYINEDRSDPTKCVVLWNYTMDLTGVDPDWETASLKISMETVNPSSFYEETPAQTPIEVCTVPVAAPAYRELVLENGAKVQSGRVSVQLNALDFAADQSAFFDLIFDSESGVLLSDGSFVESYESSGSDNVVVMRLSQIIDPNEVAALVIDGVRYPVS